MVFQYWRVTPSVVRISVMRFRRYDAFHCSPNKGNVLRFFLLLSLALACQFAKAETVLVKYHGSVSLDAFICLDVKEGSDVSRICYDKTERYMLIQLKTTYYHYCSIDAGTVQGLQAASSKRRYFESRIKGTGSDGPFDCRTHPIPSKYRK